MKLSIITINKNNAGGLKKTIDSVLSQTNKEFEYIVVDGASEDGSVEVVRNADFTCLGNFVFVSEPDSGIYNAMNKGIRMASGDYLLFLNSGDALCDKNVIDNSFAYLNNQDIIIGRINLGPNLKDVQQKCENMTLFSFTQHLVPHQATFIRRCLFLKYGLYDESLKMVADWKFFCERIIFNNCTYSYIPVTICDFDCSGITSTNNKQMLLEIQQTFRCLLPERIYADYEKAIRHKQDLLRIQWLSKHKIFHSMFRIMVGVGRRLCK